MEYGVYLESSIVDLKPKVLEFLTQIIEKAKNVKDYALSFKKKDIAELTGKDTRTISRYLNELEDRNIIKMKGRRGRAGGTVILFNRELIRFDTSDKALVNSEEPINIDDILEQKIPKKEKKQKKSSRNRRTKQQMKEAEILKGLRQSKIDKLNNDLKKLGGVPNWEWFQKTEDPTGNYRTYIISRLYNRYAALFVDRHNAEVEVYREGYTLPRVSDDYDVLPEEFYGSSRWQQFEKFRAFCEENKIDPSVYLSAQFSRSVFTAGAKNKRKMLPFVNVLLSDASYDVYRQYVEFQKKVSYSYASAQVIPSQFADDFVVRALIEAYETADIQPGMLSYRSSIADFLYGFGSTEKEDALLTFYRTVEDDLIKKNVSFKTRDIIKKFLILQSLTLSGGVSRLPGYVILGSEHTQIVLASIQRMATPDQSTVELKAKALGMLMHPNAPSDVQLNKGRAYLAQYNTLYETPKVLQLIMERKGTRLSLTDINMALKEYGKENIPVDDYSILDIDQIISKLGKQEEQEQELDYTEIVQKRDYELTGEIFTDDSLESALKEFMGSET